MKLRPFQLAVLLPVLACACATSKSGKESDVPAVDPAEALSPIRTDRSLLSNREKDLAQYDMLRVAIVDMDENDKGEPVFAFVPAKYYPNRDYCRFAGEKKTCATIGKLVTAIDPYIDRMPFGILFTYQGRLATSQEVAERLPSSYQAFFMEFKDAMRGEDIDFVVLGPANIEFFK